MNVRALRLQNFRNYAFQDVQLPSGLVALTGDNGQGKTNLLEALCVLATTKSPLVDRDRELIRWGEHETRVAANIELSGGRGDQRILEYAWRVEPGSRGTVTREMKAGGVPQSQISHWLGQLQVVAFFPHDLAILTGEPDGRRKFLNIELGKTRPVHFADASRYRRALQQRNALLRHLSESRFKRVAPSDEHGTLNEWNKQIIQYGARVLEQRARFLAELEPHLEESHRDLSLRDEPLSIRYAPGVPLPPDTHADQARWSQLFASALERNHEADLRRGTTGIGPHRDDMAFYLGDMELKRYGSQGQQRLAVLALKMALARWVEAETREPPIVLLDDALSELDATRRERLIAFASVFPQSVLTMTDAKFLGDAPATTLRVEGGHIV